MCLLLYLACHKWGDKLPRLLKLIPAWIGSIGLSIWGLAWGISLGFAAYFEGKITKPLVHRE